MLMRELFENNLAPQDSYNKQLQGIIGAYGDQLLKKIIDRMPAFLAHNNNRETLQQWADNDQYDGIFNALVDVTDEDFYKVMAVDSIIREYTHEGLNAYYWMVPNDTNDWLEGWDNFKQDPGAANELDSMLSEKEKRPFMHQIQDTDVMDLDESATVGATSAANIGTVDAPQISPGPARGKKSYTGSPGKSGTKAPPQPKVVQPKNSNGTAKNALDMKGANLFGGGTVKRS